MAVANYSIPAIQLSTLAAGDLIYRNSAGSAAGGWSRLAIGATDSILSVTSGAPAFKTLATLLANVFGVTSGKILRADGSTWSAVSLGRVKTFTAVTFTHTAGAGNAYGTGSLEFTPSFGLIVGVDASTGVRIGFFKGTSTTAGVDQGCFNIYTTDNITRCVMGKCFRGVAVTPDTWNCASMSASGVTFTNTGNSETAVVNIILCE